MCIIYKQDFNRVLDGHPNIAKTLIKNITRRVRALTEKVKSLALQDVYGRVTKVLNSLATERNDEFYVEEKLTQQDIADRVGASREMVARILKDLTIGGYISLNLGWQYIFYVLAFIGLLLILVVKLFLKESKTKDLEVSLNFKKVSISYYKVLTHKEFLLNGIAGSLIMAGMFAYIAGSPFVFMELFDLDESMYGWMFGINAVGFIGGSQLNRLLLIKFKYTNSISFSDLTLRFLKCNSVWLSTLA